MSHRLLGFLLLAVVSAARGHAAPPPASPVPVPVAPHEGSAKPPIDFTGDGVLDEKASRNVSAPMRDAVLNGRPGFREAIWNDWAASSGAPNSRRPSLTERSAAGSGVDCG